MTITNCITCKKEFKRSPSHIKKNNYCSKICFDKIQVNKIPWNKDLKGFLAEEKSPHWKGNEVGYRALHAWVNKKLGKADCCNSCGLNIIPQGRKRYFQWGNISKEYKRDLSDWIQMCASCNQRDRIGRRVSL